jgi:histidinol-phosphate/aromatic aminotransferase/cobyric acid decarboxylase-like protein
LYHTIADHYGVKAQEYQLSAEKDWEADMASMEAAVTPATKALLVNNPGESTCIFLCAPKYRLFIVLSSLHNARLHLYCPFGRARASLVII